MTTIISILLPLFALIIIGYIVGKIGVAKTNWITVLNLFGFYIAFPALIFKSLAFSHLAWWLHTSLLALHFIIGVVVLLVVVAVAKLFKLSLRDQHTVAIGSYFSMAGYLGVPALQLVYGDTAAAEGALIVAMMIIVTLTLGVALLESSRSKHIQGKLLFHSIIRNPLIWATVLGMFFSLSPWELPNVVQQFVILLAQAAAPTVLVALGIFIAHHAFQRAALGKALAIAIIKMIVLPGICLLVMVLLPDSRDWLQVTLIQLAMPVAVTNFALAEVYPMNKEVISTAIVLSTLLAFIVVPTTMWLASVL